MEVSCPLSQVIPNAGITPGKCTATWSTYSGGSAAHYFQYNLCFAKYEFQNYHDFFTNVQSAALSHLRALIKWIFHEIGVYVARLCGINCL